MLRDTDELGKAEWQVFDIAAAALAAMGQWAATKKLPENDAGQYDFVLEPSDPDNLPLPIATPVA